MHCSSSLRAEVSAMSDGRLQTVPEEAWTGGAHGRPPAVAEARAWALRGCGEAGPGGVARVGSSGPEGPRGFPQILPIQILSWTLPRLTQTGEGFFLRFDLGMVALAVCLARSVSRNNTF